MELEFQNVTLGSIKRHYRTQEFFFFKLDFEKIKFQKMGISLINLGKGAKCYIICAKKAKANFVRYIKLRQIRLEYNIQITR